jgi:hypothetical protein
VRLSSQIDRHGRTAVYGEMGLGCVGSPMRAVARLPRRRLETRPTTMGACEATATVWMLPSMVVVEKSGRGERGLLGLGNVRTAARRLVPSARGVLRRSML